MPGIAYVGEAGMSGFNSAQTSVVTYASSGGTLIFDGLFYNGSNTPCLLTDITDTAGNTWHFSNVVSQNPPQSEEYDGSSQYITTFVAWCIAAAPVTSVTIKRSDAGSNWWRATLAEFSGIGSLHAAASNNAAAGTAPSATLAVSPGDLVIGAADALSSTPGLPSGWTPFTSSGSICNGYTLSAPAGSYTPTWGLSSSGQWTVAVASFSPAGGTQSGAAALSASPALGATAHDTVLSAAHLTAAVAFSGTARETVLPSAALAGSAVLHAVAHCTMPASAHLAASGALGAHGTIGRAGRSALAASPALASSAILTRHGGVLLAGTPALGAGAHCTAVARASLGSAAVLAVNATAGISLPVLWADYQAARQRAAQAWANWRMMRSVAATDGTAGFIYGQAYEAEQAADAAYAAYIAAQERVYPGARG